MPKRPDAAKIERPLFPPGYTTVACRPFEIRLLRRIRLARNRGARLLIDPDAMTVCEIGRNEEYGTAADKIKLLHEDIDLHPN